MDPDIARLRSRLVEAVFACVAVLVLCVVILAAGVREASPAAFLAVAGFAALTALGARLPRAALALTILGIFGYYASGFPPLGMVLPATGALYLAAARGRTPWAIGGAAVLLAVATYYRVADEDPAAGFTGYEYVTEVALAAAAIALGAAVRSGRERQRQAARIAELVAAEQTHLAEQRMAEQRIRIARELHDTVGHQLTVVSLHASVASEALGGGSDAAHADPSDGDASRSPAAPAPGRAAAAASPAVDVRAARTALERVGEASSKALGELRAAVRLLRQDPGARDSGRTPFGSASHRAPAGSDPLGVAGLARTAEASGLRVECEVDASVGELRPELAEVAARILTEATTNALRHARATTLRIAARVSGGRLDLEVIDDGVGVGDGAGLGGGAGAGDGAGVDDDGRGIAEDRGAGAAERVAAPGTGIAGMRERAALAGGALCVRTAPGAGFRVLAWIPFEKEES